MPRVKFEYKKGELRVEGEGFQGKACDEVISGIVRSLGQDPNQVACDWKPEAEEVTAVSEGVGQG